MPKYRNYDQDDPWGKHYDDRERQPDREEPDNSGLTFIEHNLPPGFLTPDPPRERPYQYQGPPGLYEAYRWPEDGEHGLKYFEDAKAEYAPPILPDPAPLPTSPADDAKDSFMAGLTGDYDAAARQRIDALYNEAQRVQRDSYEPREVVELYPEAEPVTSHDPSHDPEPIGHTIWGDPIFTDQADIDDQRVADALLGLEPELHDPATAIDMEREVRQALGIVETPLSGTVYVDYAPEATSGGWNLLGDWGSPDTDTANDGAEQDVDEGDNEGDGFIWR